MDKRDIILSVYILVLTEVPCSGEEVSSCEKQNLSTHSING